MDLSTKIVGEFCVACLLAAIGIASAMTLAIIVWVMVFN